MGNKKITLFPDTNLFIECLPLEEINWKEFSEFDTVDLMVTKPVQREIDNQKKRSSGRVLKRARKTATLFRNILIKEDGSKVIQKENPTVTISIDASCKPDPKLKDELDYTQPDDAIVGIVHAHANNHKDHNVKLLTHDTGPMVTAKLVGVKFYPIPDNWLTPPVKSKDEKIIAELKNKLNLLKQQEPQVEIKFQDNNNQYEQTLNYEHIIHTPLSQDQISELMEIIIEKYPISSNFDRKHPSGYNARLSALHSFGVEKYIPPTEIEIDTYKNYDYPNWLEKCEGLLSNFHDIVKKHKGYPKFAFTILNTGNRPGKDILVTISTKGNFQIFSPSKEIQDKHEKPTLPPLPNVPRGAIKKVNFNNLAGIRNNYLKPHINSPLSTDIYTQLRPRDPNEFYWKSKQKGYPSKQFQFECQQWRHTQIEDKFSGHIFLDLDDKKINGALECRIEGENISEPIFLIAPIHIQVHHESCFDLAKSLIERSGIIEL